MGLLAGCALSEVSSDEVARFADREIRSEEWNEYVSTQAGTSAANLDSRVLSRLLDQYLDELLMVQWARDEGWLRADLPTEQVRQEILDRLALVEVTPQQESAWVEDHAADLRQPERVRMLHVLRHEREDAEAARDQLSRTGALLDTNEASGEEELVELPVEALPDVFVDVVRDLDEGEVSPLISTSAGYHLLWIEERMPARGLSPEETRSRARAALRREHTARRTREVVLAARDRYNAMVWPQNLPFEYQGAYIDADSKTRSNEPLLNEPHFSETDLNDAISEDSKSDEDTKSDRANVSDPVPSDGGPDLGSGSSSVHPL
ncbi:MAG: peptidyl-prolyl cis-trans isomerase [Thermoanaerobaculia bacterium]|nr:peptidyl-prolyl cis-trans isomerase [Thermoanaerobaculia bacterium]